MKKVVVASAMAISLIYGDSSTVLTNLSFEKSEDGDITPVFFFPIHWSSNWFSGLGYYSQSTTEIENLSDSGFDDSRMATSINQQSLKINALSYRYNGRAFSGSIGLAGEYITIDKNEFGYIHDEDGRFGQGDSWIAFDNMIGIDVIKYGLYFDATYLPNDTLSFRLSGDVTPTANVDIEQETRFKPLAHETGKHNGTDSQDISYSALAEVMVKTPLGFSIGGEYGYNFFPLKYNIATLDHNGNFYFKTGQEESETTTTSWLGKIVINRDVLGDMQPMVGFGKRNIKVKDIINNKESSTDETVVRFGIENRF